MSQQYSGKGPGIVSDTARLSLLYVDDDTTLCQAFRHVAKDAGFDVTAVTSPTQAARYLIGREFDVVAVDYRMPGMTGIQLLESVGDKLKDAYKLMVTGMCDFETVHAAINRAGVHRYVTKPWNVDELLAVLRDAAAHARLVRENRLLHARLRDQNVELAAVNRHLDAIARERTLDVLNALVAALDYRDTETQWHSRRVALFARMIGSQLGLSGDALQDVELGALLHDVGKIGISDTILMKPGKLTEDEWDVMRKHPQLGYDLLAGIDFLDTARTIVLHHHERWEGGGYPHNISGREISLGARIFAVCDTLDAITSDRPYRKARPFEVAAEEIIRVSGTQFDPEIVRAFVGIGDRWQHAIRIGHAHEDSPCPEPIDSVVARSIDVLPELGEAYAWMSAAHRWNRVPGI